MVSKSIRIASWLAMLALAATGCGGSQESHLPDGGQQELVVTSVAPGTILPGTWVRINGQGFTGSLVSEIVVVFPAAGGREVFPEEVEEESIRLQVDRALFAALGGPGGYQGDVEVRAAYTTGQTARESLEVSWTLAETLEPVISSFSAAGAIVYLGSEVEAAGSGFLMEGEGTTELRLTGTFTPEGGTAGSVERACAFVSPERDVLRVPFAADCLGIHPGVFQGQIVPVNLHAEGQEVAGSPLPDVQLELGPTLLSRVEPMAASRGQKISIQGRGFVAGNAVTTVRIEGTFTDAEGQIKELTGVDALELVPEVIDGGIMQYVMRVEPDGRGGVRGLGAESGMLAGTATPIVYHGEDTVEGIPLPEQLQFRVLPQKQVVYLKFLPGFTDALRDFGLRNVEHLIRERVMEVCVRDYEGINLEWRAVRPEDFVEYAVLEIGGRDPNGRDLIGLDNTMGKDTGNLYFDDIAGGWNADSAESGHAAFGGVFVSSYLGLSEKADDPMPLASPDFDRVFGPFMPSQGGEPVQADELPGGERAAAVEEAVHALGSMIGTTATHEIGHTLGLAAGPPDMFHNLVPADNQIMDAGIYREFEERAELNGKGPAVWTTENRAYLEAILPVE